MAKSKIKITDIKVCLISDKTKVKAFVKIQINDCLLLNDLRVYELHDGTLTIIYPRVKKTKIEEMHECVFYPKDKETRKYIEQIILSKYHEVCDNGGSK